MNKYICVIQETENISAKPIMVEVEGYTRAYAVRIAEINFPDYKILKISRKIGVNSP